MNVKRRWAGEGGAENGDEEVVGPSKGKGKTGMMMRWQGHGFPLTVDLYVSFALNSRMTCLSETRETDVSRQDDAKGPTTTCELRVLEPEELMNQEFNQDEASVDHLLGVEDTADVQCPLSHHEGKIRHASTHTEANS